MNIRWNAVLIGFLLDLMLSALISAYAGPDFAKAIDITQPHDLIILALSALVIGIGGYTAGRIAGEDRAMNGFMVGTVDVLFTTFQGGVLARPLLVTEAIAWALAALGGYLSRFPAAPAVSRPTRRQ